MANRTYLYNTERPVEHPYVLREGDDPVGQAVQVGEQARAIPLAWMLAFRPDDAKPFTYTPEGDEDGAPEAVVEGLAFCVTRERALQNLQSALPLFERVLEDPQRAKESHEDALRFFGALPLPYVMLDALELIDGDFDAFRRALGGSREGVIALRRWSLAAEWLPFGKRKRSSIEAEVDPVAVFREAIRHYHGAGVARDIAAAARLTQEAAMHGHYPAQYAWAVLHLRGEGVERDDDEIRKCMSNAAGAGYEPARRYLAAPRWKFWARPKFPTSAE
jgi:hypothetical protein